MFKLDSQVNLTIATFLNSKDSHLHKSHGNIKVLRRDGTVEVYFHGSKIFKFNSRTSASFCMCGFNTPSTRRKINSILEYHFPGYRLFQRKFNSMVSLPCGNLIKIDSHDVISVPYDYRDNHPIYGPNARVDTRGQLIRA
jgi:hypothetical protein